MNTITKVLISLVAAALLLVGACQNASDDTDPGLFDLRVNGAATLFGADREHQLGTLTQFEMNLSDNRALAEFQMDVEGILVYTEQLEGTSDAVAYDFAINADTYSVGDTLQVTFTAEDASGNINVQPYFMFIVE